MTTSGTLTLQEFHAAYGNQHGYEYWFGEVVRKGMPTSLHGTAQFVLMRLFRELGYKAACEVELRIDPDWEPRPDVIVSSVPLEQPYPTKAEQITVVEVLSQDDSLAMMYKKCQNYDRIGIPLILLVDPESREAWRFFDGNIEQSSSVRIPRSDTWFNFDRVWEELDKELR